MIPTFISKRKSFSTFFDLFFPPLCLSCGEKCKTKYLCPSCWTLCTLLDPIERCRHCFDPLDGRGALCPQCRIDKLLPVQRAYVFEKGSPAKLLGIDEPEALAGFAYYQWIQLEWPKPDVIIPMRDRASIDVAFAFSQLIDAPLVKDLASLDEEQIEDIFLFDVANSIDALKEAAENLLKTFPKRIYILSLHGDVNNTF